MDVSDYTICACRGCGLRFLNPQPTPEALEAFYTKQYYHSDDSLSQGYGDYVAQADNLRSTFRHRLRYLPKAETLLDVGAAAGFFVEQAREAGWKAEGIDPSDWAARFAREQLGVPVRTGHLEEAGFPAASFDAVTAWEVIEHLPDPRTVLLEMARILKPGGLLALSTPDAGAPVSRLAGRRWLGWYKVPEHLYFFDRKTLMRLLEETGFEVTSCRYVSLDVTWSFALKRLSELLGIPIKVPAWLAHRTGRVNPGYDLMILARRK
jgi:2-polyprenyl-3-methyl-5-hydroxy-6-metoxy-1,4-benzoquinol methylase